MIYFCDNMCIYTQGALFEGVEDWTMNHQIWGMKKIRLTS